MALESTQQNLPERLRHFSRIGKDRPDVLIAAPLIEAAEEIERLRSVVAQIADVLLKAAKL